MTKTTLPFLSLILLIGIFPGAAQAQADDATIKQCSAQHPVGVARADCLAPWLEDIVVRSGAGNAMETIDRLVKGGVMDDCHVMAHTVGHAVWGKTRELRTAFGACGSGCVQGCWHGVMEASMMGPAAQRIESRQALAFCDALGQGTLERRQCLHGLGHGVMHQRRDNVMAAVAECESIGGRYETDQCLGGLWMQWTHFPLHEGADAFANKAPALCSTVRRDLVGKCALALGGAAMFATAHDEGRSIAICKQLPAAQQRDCIKGVRHELDVLRVHGSHQH
jgi:hypothetical protein